MKKFIKTVAFVLSVLFISGSVTVSAYTNDEVTEFIRNFRTSAKISVCKSLLLNTNEDILHTDSIKKSDYINALDTNADNEIDVFDIIRYKHEILKNGDIGESWFEDTSSTYYFDIPDSEYRIVVVEDSFLIACSDDVFIEYPDGTRIKIGYFSGDDGHRPIEANEYEISFSYDNSQVTFTYSFDGGEAKENWHTSTFDIPQTNPVIVSDSDELKNALSSAKPNDEIILKTGIYQTSESGKKSSLFMSSADGTEDMPITIRSEYSSTKAILKGDNEAEHIVLYITGDNWIIKDLKISTAQKGIVLDNSNNSLIDNCEVYNIGSEGIHLRDNSSYCTISNSKIHDTGVVSPKYGEGIYIGSAMSTSGYGYNCDYNKVSHCTFENIAAEHVDIKEYTTGTIIENCDMFGKGISGENYADSFIDIKGNKAVIRNNYCYQQENDIIKDAFQLHVVAEGWGFDNEVYGNTVYLDSDSAYVLTGWNGSVTAYDNKRIPEGLMYYGDAVTSDSE